MGGRAATALRVKLLLDEMHNQAVAAALRARGHDVIAVTERADLISLTDQALLRSAAAAGLAIVTENIKDFVPLHRQVLAAGERHAGMVLTHPRRFPRSARNHAGVLTQALAVFLDEQAEDLHGVESFLWWLEAARR